MSEPLVDSTSAHDLLRACHTRRLDREGIPMVLALVDERGALPPRSDAQSRLDGRRYADLLGAYGETLVPAPVFRPSDEGVVITALQVLAAAHFEPAASEGGDDA